MMYTEILTIYIYIYIYIYICVCVCVCVCVHVCVCACECKYTLLCLSFFTPALADSLSQESARQQVPSTLHSIVTDLYNVLV